MWFIRRWLKRFERVEKWLSYVLSLYYVNLFPSRFYQRMDCHALNEQWTATIAMYVCGFCNSFHWCSLLPNGFLMFILTILICILRAQCLSSCRPLFSYCIYIQNKSHIQYNESNGIGTETISQKSLTSSSKAYKTILPLQQLIYGSKSYSISTGVNWLQWYHVII